MPPDRPGRRRRRRLTPFAGAVPPVIRAKLHPRRGYLAIAGLWLLDDGVPAPKALDRLVTEDPGRDGRQFDIVDAGGDTKGHQSATVLVLDTEDYPLWDLHVDHSDAPLAELHALHAVFAQDLLP